MIECENCSYVAVASNRSHSLDGVDDIEEVLLFEIHEATFGHEAK